MEQSIHFDSVSTYNVFGNHPTYHPLISVLDLSKAKPNQIKHMHIGIYAISLKGIKVGDLRYGKGYYDLGEGTLVFFSPGQVLHIEGDEEWHQPQGLILVFHPDLIRGTTLARHFHEYTFFSYKVNEGLHLSKEEQKIIKDCFANIEKETKRVIDKHSKRVIVANLELLLTYCVRFYDRQFITRETVNLGILERFESLLNSYLTSDKPQTIGLPTVKYFADELNLSANYFGDLLKKETGKTPLEYIQLKLIDTAKEKLFDDGKTISEIAYELGFTYPSHFTRLFKAQVGYTPNEYRSLN
ncbi:AraC family transcriptional regulator [Rhodocytophaga rosea]|uniref:AraC family transcriptional regulator n=1 Tax=Rhodocytophaga rosea TaxID=2704465 RepID=A0A6C0GHY8_9BACT|nr:helix-turn-helix transcriptional regulator [Rhodocytophaga rosea]QHT67313.1 AraC family transcriptional regulator [Rhodocytophaga rosea]